MKQTSISHTVTPHDYVQQLSLRHPLSRQAYLSTLNGFQRFVTKEGDCVSEKTIRKWLKNRILVWPFHLVANRARLVDRFLDWAVQKGGLSENPLAKLRKEYGQRTTAPVVRALPQSPLRPRTAYIMLALAYSAGLRLGEIVRLNVGDLDLESRTIEIRNTKFFKTRRLPLSNSAAAALQSYLDVRRLAGAPTEPSAGLFWHWHNRGPGRYSYVMTEKLLVRVLRCAGIKPMRGKLGPRIHDLRHAFVVHRMLAWYREGINPQPYLPYLATYLGHRDINSTLVYLTITQELLQHAGERFRQLGAIALHGTAGGEQ